MVVNDTKNELKTIEEINRRDFIERKEKQRLILSQVYQTNLNTN